MGRPKSEVRRLTKCVAVRFTEDDLRELQLEADRLAISVPELLRETGLNRVRGRSYARAAS